MFRIFLVIFQTFILAASKVFTFLIFPFKFPLLHF